MGNYKITINSTVINVSESYDGEITAERNSKDGKRWFVLTETFGKFYLQENLADGGIIEIGTYNTIMQGLEHLAKAEYL